MGFKEHEMICLISFLVEGFFGVFDFALLWPSPHILACQSGVIALILEQTWLHRAEPQKYHL